MNEIKFVNLDQTNAFKKLRHISRTIALKDRLTPERVKNHSITTGGGLTYNYAAKLIDEEILESLAALSAEQQLPEKCRALVNGEIMNTGEKRRVLHHLTRGQLGDDIIEGGKNLRHFYRDQQKRIFDFAKKVHSGDLKGSTGRPFDTVVQIGIGGSDLGPRALYLALKNYAEHQKNELKMKAYFISNVDPDDANEVLEEVDFETSLFILVSKSGTTQETLTNMDFVLRRMQDAGITGLDGGKHMIAVTSASSPLASSADFLDAFFIDDYIGGRYSSTSAVGGAVLSLAFGRDCFRDLLKGAHEADKSAMREDIFQNASLMDALIGVYERNVLNIPVTAVLPYSQALSRFPAHLQQLDMESNGKSVNRLGIPVSYSTGPVVFGEPGTNGQHSFYQLLHQGTDIIPLQFVGFLNSQTGFDIEVDGSTSQRKLNANLAAQIAAFAFGKENDTRSKRFAGNRPSSLLYGDQLTAESLGALLAHFENKIMYQGFIWNINSFDQEGVQLGKILAKQILQGDVANPALEEYVKLLDPES